MRQRATIDPINCPTCNLKLQFLGTREFHEGGGSPLAHFFLGGWAELSESRMNTDVYVCPRCGRIELFIVGIGDEFRGQYTQEEIPEATEDSGDVKPQTPFWER